MLLHVRKVAICDLEAPHPRARSLSKVQRVSRIFPREINAEQRLEGRVSHQES